MAHFLPNINFWLGTIYPVHTFYIKQYSNNLICQFIVVVVDLKLLIPLMLSKPDVVLASARLFIKLYCWPIRHRKKKCQNTPFHPLNDGISSLRSVTYINSSISITNKLFIEFKFNTFIGISKSIV